MQKKKFIIPNVHYSEGAFILKLKEDSSLQMFVNPRLRKNNGLGTYL